MRKRTVAVLFTHDERLQSNQSMRLGLLFDAAAVWAFFGVDREAVFEGFVFVGTGNRPQGKACVRLERAEILHEQIRFLDRQMRRDDGREPFPFLNDFAQAALERQPRHVSRRL